MGLCVAFDWPQIEAEVVKVARRYDDLGLAARPSLLEAEEEEVTKAVCNLI